ncbi:ribbon-helix-helix protein, CopG family [Actinomyces faecalis]|nr:ribbon-helix-helix protein, CopG family [Actinomyces faecalis]
MRLTDDEVALLDRLASSQHLTRSEALRRALMSAA